MVDATPVARSITCQNCGGAIAVGQNARVKCPFCGVAQTIPRRLLTELRRYRARAQNLAALIDAERQDQASWTSWYERMGCPRAQTMELIATATPPVLVLVGGYVLVLAGVASQSQFAGFALPACIATYVIGVATHGWPWDHSSRWRPRPRLKINARCPHCGGTLAYTLGALGHRCPHCGESTITGERVEHQSLDAAQAELRLARMSRYRLERADFRSGVQRNGLHIVLGLLLVPLSGGAIMLTIAAAHGDPHLHAAHVLSWWALALVDLAALLTVLWLQTSRRTWIRAIALLTAPHVSGRISTAAADWLAWLNTYWTGPYPSADLLAGPCFHVVLGTLADYPIAFDLEPIPADEGEGRHRADVLLSAYLPGDLETLTIPSRLQRQAGIIGFELTWNAGGMVAHALNARALLKSSALDAADALIAVSNLLLEWARNAGAPPGLAVPEDEIER